MTDLNQSILEIISKHVGGGKRGHQISWENLTWELMGDSGMFDYSALKVAVREAIEQMRDSGIVICSDQRGYFLPANESELNKFLEDYRGPALKRLHTAKMIDDGRANYFAKQLTLDSGAGEA